MVRAGLRLLQDEQREDAAKLRNLRRAAKEGFDAIDRGEFVTVTDKTLAAHLKSLGANRRGDRSR